MKWIKYGLVLTISMAFLMETYTAQAAEPFLLPGEIVLDESTGDVTGDGAADRIYLIGKAGSRNELARAINIVVADGKSGEFSRSNFSAVVGERGRLFISDFNGDKISDVMFAVQSGGEISCFAAAFNHDAPETIYVAEQSPRSGEIVIVREEEGQTFNIKSGSRIQLRLPENPSTGYVWHFNSFDTRYLEFLGQQNFVPADQPGMTGKPGLKVFMIQTVGQGTVTLDLSNYRVWEGPASAADHFKVTVNII